LGNAIKEVIVRVLLAVDGSEASTRAATQLVKSLGWYKAPPEIDLLTVHLPVPKLHNMGVVVTHEMIERHYGEESAAALAPVRAVLDAAGIKYGVHRAVGPIAETIVAQATERGADIICMGTRGMNAVSNMVLGSVATKVLHVAKVPVLLAP
jgi:nucleotide-binding universal stress UspA family protein